MGLLLICRYVEENWANLKVGDILCVENNQPVPVSLIKFVL